MSLASRAAVRLLGRTPVFFLFVILGLSGRAHADVTEDVAVLRSDVLHPDERARREARLSDREQPVTAAQLEPLLSQGSPFPGQLSGARILEARAEPDLAALAFQSLLASHARILAGSADVSEPLRAALETIGIEELGEYLVQPEALDRVLHTVRISLASAWFEPVGGVDALPPLTDGWRERAAALWREWVQAVVATGSTDVMRLDNRDSLARLRVRLHGLLLADLIASPDPEMRDLALEVALQLGDGTPEIREAAKAVGDVGRARDVVALPFELEWPLGPPRVAQGETVPPDLAPIDGDWLDEGRWRFRPSPLGMLALVSVLGFLGVLLLGRSPRTRRWAFPLAAMMIAPVGLVLVEVVLALLGVQPRAVDEPTFDLRTNPNEFFEEVYPDDADGTWFATTDWQSHYQIFPRDFPEKRLRVVSIGGSSAVGTHHRAEHTWPLLLEAPLEEALGRPVHAVSASSTGLTSGGLYAYVNQSLQLEPDLFVFYGGWNDYVFVPQLARYEGWTLRNMQVAAVLDRLRVARGLSALLSPVSKRLADEGATLVEEGPSEDDQQRLRRLAGRYLEGNWIRAIRKVRQEGIPVLLVIQPENEVFCDPDTNDPLNTGSCFLPEVEADMRRIAKKTGAPLLDLPGAMRARNGGPIGFESFWDEVHHTRLGHAVVATEIAAAAARVLGKEGRE